MLLHNYLFYPSMQAIFPANNQKH